MYDKYKFIINISDYIFFWMGKYFFPMTIMIRECKWLWYLLFYNIPYSFTPQVV